MKQFRIGFRHYAARRRFLKNGLLAAGAATLGTGLLGERFSAFGQEEKSGSLPPGDAAILRFLAAAEIIETDLWEQYAELGGVQTEKSEIPGLSGGNPLYTAALQLLDGDMPQYIHDNTDDEITHQQFINAYLRSKGAAESTSVSLPPSRGARRKGRAEKSGSRTSRTSRWIQVSGRGTAATRTIPILIPISCFHKPSKSRIERQFPGMTKTRTAVSLTPTAYCMPLTIKAIAFTAGFHFAFIEQGGTSLYPSLAQRVTSPEVLRILLSIGPTETMHFQTWQDKAGNANAGNPPLTDVDRTGASVTFTDLIRKHLAIIASQLDHAGADLLPQSQIPPLFNHSPD